MWDTVGGEPNGDKFKNNAPNIRYLELLQSVQFQIIILFCDTTDYASLEHLKCYAELIRDYHLISSNNAKSLSCCTAPIILVGTKTDLAKAKNITDDEIKKTKKQKKQIAKAIDITEGSIKTLEVITKDPNNYHTSEKLNFLIEESVKSIEGNKPREKEDKINKCCQCKAFYFYINYVSVRLFLWMFMGAAFGALLGAIAGLIDIHGLAPIVKIDV